MKKTVIILLFLLLTGCVSSGPGVDTTRLETEQALQDWKQSQATTDGCSSPWYVGMWTVFLDKNWDDCCWQHDFDYGVGVKHDISRSMADEELHDCVEASGHPVVADLMWAAVRLFGWSHYESGEK